MLRLLAGLFQQLAATRAATMFGGFYELPDDSEF